MISPYYWKVGEETLYQHFAAVANAVEIPILLYNFPLLTGIDLSPALVGRLAGGHPNIVGIKDTVRDPDHTNKILLEVKSRWPEFSVLVGFEDQILSTVVAGADGSISGLANVAPEMLVGLVQAIKDKEYGAAVELHQRILPLMSLYELTDPGVGAMKAAMAKVGVPINPAVRGPALAASSAEQKEIELKLKQAGLLAAKL